MLHIWWNSFLPWPNAVPESLVRLWLHLILPFATPNHQYGYNIKKRIYGAHLLVLGMAWVMLVHCLLLGTHFIFCNVTWSSVTLWCTLSQNPPDYKVSVNCTNFRDLSFNKLTDKVPVNFGAMMALQYLWEIRSGILLFFNFSIFLLMLYTK